MQDAIGDPWRDLPERYGSGNRIKRLRLWTKDGTWDEIFDHSVVKDDVMGDVEWGVRLNPG
ncbi:transposase [Amycolatopsis sp. SB7-3]|uniref:transposase n=1 Tax=Amycolatopsis sp. SB7-3 TaxID=3373438 RepID=UPI003744B025